MRDMHINSDRYNTPFQGNRGQESYRGYTKKSQEAAPATTEEADASSATGSETDKTCREPILEKMAEMAKKVKDGTVEPTFQIGAMSYTMKEWDKLLEKFDAAEEALQEAVQAQIEEVEEQAAKEALRRELNGKEEGTGKETAAVVTKSAAETIEAETTAAETGTVEDAEQTAALLTDEVTKCSYPTEDPKQKHWFITAYGSDGISCREAYFDGTRWVNRDCFSISYTQEGQYEKVMAFLKWFPSDANLRFAAKEDFWRDFLSGEIDEDAFAAFFETTNNGAIDYTYTEGDSAYIDPEKAKYAQYMNLDKNS